MDEIKAVTYVRCGKRRFTSRKYAKQFLKKSNRFLNFDLTTVYFCESCVAWHTTTMNKKESRKLSRPKAPPKPVGKYLNNILIERYESIGKAAKAIKTNPSDIKKAISENLKLSGLTWKFVQ